MNENWVWLPDWASDLSLWEDDLIELSPKGKHEFVSYEKMVSCLENIYDIAELCKADHVVGWGMGALVLLKNCHKRPKNQEWILLSPFTDFCSEENHWNHQNLMFIASQTKVSVDPFLNAYMELFEDEFGDWVDEWKSSAKKMSSVALGNGLSYLAQTRIDCEISFKGNPKTKVLFGRMDRAIKPSMTLKLQKYLPEVEFKERPKAGHWPPMLLF